MKNKKRDIAIVLMGLSILAYLFNSIVLITIVLFLLLAALLSEKAIDCILFVWDKFAKLLGYINTKIILFVFYFIILTPYSWVMKRFNKNQMQSKGVKTQFVDTFHEYKSADFDNMW
jgi:hypothetical protein